MALQVPGAVPGNDASSETGSTGPSSIRDLKALVGDGGSRRSFGSKPSTGSAANLPLIPPAPPALQDIGGGSRASSRLNNSRPGSGTSKLLDRRRRSPSVSKGKYQVALEDNEERVGAAAKIDWTEDGFVKGMDGVTEGHIREAFNQLDFDGNGFVGVSELRYMLSVLGEEPSDVELDEMIAILGGEGDGQIAFEDFLKMFQPDHVVMAQMMSQAPKPQRVQEDSSDEEAAGEKPPPKQANLGLLIKGAAGFMHKPNKKDTTGKKKILGKPKAKQPGSKRARPVLSQPKAYVAGQMPGVPQAGQQGQIGSASLMPPPVPGHLPSMPPLPPGYLIDVKAKSGPTGLPPGMLPGMLPGQPGMAGQMLPGMAPGAYSAAADPLLQPSGVAAQATANMGPQSLTFGDYREMKAKHEEELARQKALEMAAMED